MERIESRINTSSPEYRQNFALMEAAVKKLRAEIDRVRQGGPEQSRRRHLERGKLLVRDRIKKLLDPQSAFLELSPLAAWGMYEDEAPGAGIVTGVGRLQGREVVVVANDATVKGGTYYPITVKKHLRAQEIAMQNHLPCVYLVDSGGAFLPLQSEVFPDREHFGRIFYNMARMSAAGIPQVAAVMGSCTAGGAYVPAMCDENIIVREQGTIFLGGPPLVRAATGEEVSAEELGGGDVHTRLSGVSDYLADDDEHALAIARSIFESLGPRAGLEYALQQEEPEDPYYDPREIYGVVSGDTRRPYEVRELIARLVDGSRMHEFKPRYGATPGHRLRAHLRLSGRHNRQQRGVVQRIRAQGDAFHRALLRAAHPAAFLAEHHRLHGRQTLRAGRNRQGRGQDGQRGGQRAGAEVHGDNRSVERGRKLRDVRAGVLAADAFHVAQRAHLRDGGRAGGQHAC